MSFEGDLFYLYYLGTDTKRLRSDYLDCLVMYLSSAYKHIRPPVTEEKYENYLRQCVLGLLHLTDEIHPIALQSKPVKFLFTTKHKASEYIGKAFPEAKRPRDQFVFASGQFDAFWSFAKRLTFSNFFDDHLVIHPLYVSEVSDPGNCPFSYSSAEKSEQREWDRKVEKWHKADQKASDEAYDALSTMEIVMVGSALFQYADFVLPTFEVLEPFEIPEDIRFRGVFCCAPQGRGKSNLLRTMVEDDRKKNGCVILMDPKGDLIDCYRDKAFVIQPSLINPPQINPLALGSSTQAIDLLEYIFSSVLENELTAGQSTIFHAVLSLATLVPNANISTVTDILRNGHGKYLGYMKLLDKEDRTFFLDDWNEKNYKERRPQIIQRIRYLTRNPYIRAMLNTTKNTIDFGKLMDGQNLVIIDNSYDPDMLGDLGCEFFGRLVIALIRAAAFKRAALEEKDKNPVYFYIDEAHTVIKRDATIASILRQCRSQKIAMTFANQALMDYEEHVRSALMDCGVFMVNPGAEAPHWVQRLNLSKEGVDALRNLPTHTFATYVETVTPSAVNISVDWLELPKTRRKKEVVPTREPEPEPEEDVDSPLSPSEKY